MPREGGLASVAKGCALGKQNPLRKGSRLASPRLSGPKGGQLNSSFVKEPEFSDVCIFGVLFLLQGF